MCGNKLSSVVVILSDAKNLGLFASLKITVLLFTFLPLACFSQQQDWEFYFTNIDDKPASVALNLALHDTAPLPDKTYCFWIILPFHSVDSLGFPSEKENDTLNKIEDELETFLQKRSKAIYAGRTTCAGERQFYYYSKSIDSADVFIEEVFKNYTAYKYKLGQRYDESWIVYFDFLYPSDIELQLIYNKRITDALAKNGDNPAITRHIDHWLMFEKKKDMNDFVKALEGKPYTVEKNVDEKFQDGEKSMLDEVRKSHPFRVQISEESKADLETIDNSVLQLMELASKFKGVYGGWETFVEE